MNLIDLRSDTVTRPTTAMREAMTGADVGDDVYGEDPTVTRLEETAAALLGKQAGLFVPSGTQSNLCALLAHCGRGDEYIVGQDGHTYKYEAGGAAVLGSIQPQPIEYEPDGSLDLAKVEAKVKPDDFHFARTRLLCLENTQGGKVLSLAYQKEAREFARRKGLAIHLDGARIFNASVKLGVEVREIADCYDSVSICLSKGLGAPVGSVLLGDEAFIGRARRWRKMLGGGMRQAGILAAAGLYALAHNVERLAEDHENARVLAEGLARIPGVAVDPASAQTNMVFVVVDGIEPKEFVGRLRERGVAVSPARRMRLVTHLDVSRADVEHAVEAFRDSVKPAEHAARCGPLSVTRRPTSFIL